MWDYKVDNDANIANFVWLWKSQVFYPNLSNIVSLKHVPNELLNNTCLL